MSNDRSCYDCKYYHAEYCDDFTYKDARILLDPISLSKEQVRDIYEFLNGKGNATGEELYKKICEDVSRAITERLTAEAERLIVAADRDRRIDELQEKMLKGEGSHEELQEYLKLAKEAELDIHKPLVRTCEKCGKKFITRYRVARVCQKCQEEN